MEASSRSNGPTSRALSRGIIHCSSHLRRTAFCPVQNTIERRFTSRLTVKTTQFDYPAMSVCQYFDGPHKSLDFSIGTKWKSHHLFWNATSRHSLSFLSQSVMSSRKRKGVHDESAVGRALRLANKKARRLSKQVNTAKLCVDDLIQRDETTKRIDRAQETRDRNAQMQRECVFRKALGRKVKVRARAKAYSRQQLIEDDRAAFLEAIDTPIAFICGSCGEFASPRVCKVCDIASSKEFLAPLAVDNDLRKGLVKAAVVKHEANSNECQSVPICNPCQRMLKRRQAPRYSAAGGWRLADVPSELAVLNPIEARMIGLGVCFTTCYRLRGDGQEGTRGNSISYWNDSCNFARKLPRPLHRCGVVRVKSSGNGDSPKLFAVRPNLLREALQWLVRHNPLYAGVEIDNDVLQELGDRQTQDDLPAIRVDDTGVGHERVNVNDRADANSDIEIVPDGAHSDPIASPVGAGAGKSAVSLDTRDANDSICTDEGERLRQCGQTATQEHYYDDLDTEDCFGMVDNPVSSSETSQLLQSIVGEEAPVVDETLDMRPSSAAINEYGTQKLMQFCFPTLFPDGRGGYRQLDDSETRPYKYELADFCSHLMSWHDRRFVMHKTFKFFCLNLIQRRQIDGLVRRIPSRGISGSTSAETNSSQERQPPSGDADRPRQVGEEARAVLRQLKPYFKSIRGSDLYWADVRDELMDMIGNNALPTPWPTFFFTLSAADTIWPDFFRACNPVLTWRAAARLVSTERRRCLAEFPDIASQHFSRRFKAFFDNILDGASKPLGTITDFFWRVEFQKRGSPHIHGLLWVKDAPDVIKLSQTEEGRAELASFVDRHISAGSETPPENGMCSCGEHGSADDDETPDILAVRPSQSVSQQRYGCEIHRIVDRVQMHRCAGGRRVEPRKGPAALSSRKSCVSVQAWSPRLRQTERFRSRSTSDAPRPSRTTTRQSSSTCGEQIWTSS